MRNRSFHLAMWAMFLALLILLTFTPIGFIPIGPLKATIVHCPVILMGMLFGIKDGVLAGMCFGVASLVSNTLMPGVLSFAFTPFISIGGIAGNWMSLVICFLPRMILGLTSGWCGLTIHKRGWLSIGAMVISLLHSFLVLSLIGLWFGPEYALVSNIATTAIVTVLASTFITQSMVESILAMAFIYLIYPLIHSIHERHML